MKPPKEHTETINKIWSLLGITCLYFSFNALSRTWKAKIVLPGISLETIGPYTAGIFGITMGSVLISVLSYTFFEHLKSTDKAGTWHNRFPVFMNVSLDQDSKFFKNYQRFFFFSFHAFPAICQPLFFAKFLKGSLFLNGNDSPLLNGWEHIFDYYSFSELFQGDKYRFETTSGVSFWPFWEPWILTLLCLFSFALSVFVIIRLFQSTPTKNTDI